jgi:CBS domain-containing protein
LFQSVLAFVSVENKPPLGFFRTLVLERAGEHKDALDLKLRGTGPIVNAARLYALDAGIASNNTAERLSALAALENPPLPADLLRDLTDAFEFLTLLRLECQLQQARENRPLDNYVRPDSLSHLQRNLMKEAFRAVARAQSAIDTRYGSAVWAQLGSR